MDAIDELYEGVAVPTLKKVAAAVHHAPAYADLVKELRGEHLAVEPVVLPASAE